MGTKLASDISLQLDSHRDRRVLAKVQIQDSIKPPTKNHERYLCIRRLVEVSSRGPIFL